MSREDRIASDLAKSFKLVEAALQGSQLYPHACKSCQRSYFVYRKPPDSERGIDACCVCRKGELVTETYATKTLFGR